MLVLLLIQFFATASFATNLDCQSIIDPTISWEAPVPETRLQITSEIVGDRERLQLVDLDRQKDLFAMELESTTGEQDQPRIYSATYGFVPQKFDNAKIPKENLINFEMMKKYETLLHIDAFVRKHGRVAKISVTVDHQYVVLTTNQTGLGNQITEPHEIRLVVFKKTGELAKIVTVAIPNMGGWAYDFAIRAVSDYINNLVNPMEDPAAVAAVNREIAAQLISQ